VFEDDLLSDVYVGWVRGYLDEQRAAFEQALSEDGPLAAWRDRIHIMHPREAFLALAEAMREPEHASWLA